MSVLIKRISSTASSTRRIAPFSGGVLTSGLGSKVNVCGGGFFSERPVETPMSILPQLASPSAYLRGGLLVVWPPGTPYVRVSVRGAGHRSGSRLDLRFWDQVPYNGSHGHNGDGSQHGIGSEPEARVERPCQGGSHCETHLPDSDR
jgi:hypothetical protein